ncbi:hypothetical protein V3C99_007670, partial [Haemonchus contortus]
AKCCFENALRHKPGSFLLNSAKRCLHAGLNRRPSVYETDALPLSYRGALDHLILRMKWFCEKCSLRLMAKCCFENALRHKPGSFLLNSAKRCLHAGLNRRPSVYETDALPLSYRGALDHLILRMKWFCEKCSLRLMAKCCFENALRHKPGSFLLNSAKRCLHAGLNRRPSVYETDALPLSYRGALDHLILRMKWFCEKCSLRLMAKCCFENALRHKPGSFLLNSAKRCLHAGLNRRPSVYETDALPLSYRGALDHLILRMKWFCEKCSLRLMAKCCFENALRHKPGSFLLNSAKRCLHAGLNRRPSVYETDALPLSYRGALDHLILRMKWFCEKCSLRLMAKCCFENALRHKPGSFLLNSAKRCLHAGLNRRPSVYETDALPLSYRGALDHLILRMKWFCEKCSLRLMAKCCFENALRHKPGSFLLNSAKRCLHAGLNRRPSVYETDALPLSYRGALDHLILRMKWFCEKCSLRLMAKCCFENALRHKPGSFLLNSAKRCLHAGLNRRPSVYETDALPLSYRGALDHLILRMKWFCEKCSLRLMAKCCFENALRHKPGSFLLNSAKRCLHAGLNRRPSVYETDALPLSYRGALDHLILRMKWFCEKCSLRLMAKCCFENALRHKPGSFLLNSAKRCLHAGLNRRPSVYETDALPLSYRGALDHLILRMKWFCEKCSLRLMAKCCFENALRHKPGSFLLNSAKRCLHAGLNRRPSVYETDALPLSYRGALDHLILRMKWFCEKCSLRLMAKCCFENALRHKPGSFLLNSAKRCLHAGLNRRPSVYETDALPLSYRGALDHLILRMKWFCEKCSLRLMAKCCFENALRHKPGSFLLNSAKRCLHAGLNRRPSVYETDALPLSYRGALDHLILRMKWFCEKCSLRLMAKCCFENALRHKPGSFLLNSAKRCLHAGLNRRPSVYETDALPLSYRGALDHLILRMKWFCEKCSLRLMAKCCFENALRHKPGSFLLNSAKRCLHAGLNRRPSVYETDALPLSYRGALDHLILRMKWFCEKCSLRLMAKCCFENALRHKPGSFLLNSAKRCLHAGLNRRPSVYETDALPLSYRGALDHLILRMKWFCEKCSLRLMAKCCFENALRHKPGSFLLNSAKRCLHAGLNRRPSVYETDALPLSYRGALDHLILRMKWFCEKCSLRLMAKCCFENALRHKPGSFLLNSAKRCLHAGLNRRPSVYETDALPLSYRGALDHLILRMKWFCEKCSLRLMAKCCFENALRHKPGSFLLNSAKRCLHAGLNRRPSVYETDALPLSYRGALDHLILRMKWFCEKCSLRLMAKCCFENALRHKPGSFLLNSAKRCLHAGLNRRPSVYETDALPLSYRGALDHLILRMKWFCEKCSLRLMAKCCFENALRHKPGSFLLNSAKRCLHAGLNRRPSVYETDALPLSYRGALDHLILRMKWFCEKCSLRLMAKCCFENALRHKPGSFLLNSAKRCLHAGLNRRPSVYETDALPLSYRGALDHLILRMKWFCEKCSLRLMAKCCFENALRHKPGSFLLNSAKRCLHAGLNRRPSVYETDALPLSYRGALDHLILRMKWFCEKCSLRLMAKCCFENALRHKPGSFLLNSAKRCLHAGLNRRPSVYETDALPLSYRGALDHLILRMKWFCEKCSLRLMAKCCFENALRHKPGSFLLNSAKRCLHAGLNRRPSVYETDALPLSYRGALDHLILRMKWFCEKCSLRLMAKCCFENALRHKPGSFLLNSAKRCLHAGLNRRPSVYETDALPLSYRGALDHLILRMKWFCEKCSLRLMAKCCFENALRHKPGSFLLNSAKRCLHAGLNRRPSVYETDALPLSYRGALDHLILRMKWFCEKCSLRLMAKCCFENALRHKPGSFLLNSAKRCLHAGLNRRPSVYETDALPLSYRGALDHLILRMK